jgi:hypothetical protein
MRICNNGHKVRKERNKQLKKEYPFYCFTCNENKYKFETIIVKNGLRFIPWKPQK